MPPSTQAEAHPGTGRLHDETPDPLRTSFELDRHRIITSTAFRRMRGKTQVFAAGFHDHFRNRMMHSLEVAQIARNLARNLQANEGLCEAVALAHDLGHPPFSHAGEKALNELMTGRGGFNHNVHSLRVVEFLEHPYPQFRGLNLTQATLAGLRAHATQFDEPEAAGRQHVFLEAQIVSLADRIAFNLHDLEDAIGEGIVDEGDLKNLALWRDGLAQAGLAGEAKHLHAVRRPVLDSILNALLLNLIESSPLGPRRGEGTRAAQDQEPLGFSATCSSAVDELEQFLMEHVYRHAKVARTDAEGRQKIHELFSAYMRRPELLPDHFARRIGDMEPHRVICDYIAGMTDAFCTNAHKEHCENQVC